MVAIAKDHIDHDYRSCHALPYYTDAANKEAFLVGEFIDDQASHVKRSNGTSWTKRSFEDFVLQHASCVDSKYMYQCCLAALFRGHDHITGGLMRLKKAGLQLWKRLKDAKTYEIGESEVYTCISGSQGLTRFKSHDNACGVIQARPGMRQLTVTGYFEPV